MKGALQPFPPLDVAALSDIGLKRERNEDANRILVPPSGVDQEAFGAMFVVADGMGGLGGGDVASRCALDEFTRVYYETIDPDLKLVDRLQMALQSASDAVKAQGPKIGLPRIGSTAAGVILVPGGAAMIFNVGDCRVYRIHERHIERVSHDQSVMERNIEGGMSPEQAAQANNSSLVTSFLGQPRPLEPELRVEQFREGDIYVICSDGLWSLVKADEIMRIVSSSAAKTAARKLIDLTLKRGAHDNVTAMVVRLGNPPRGLFGFKR